jgi:hypothetical protein
MCGEIRLMKASGNISSLWLTSRGRDVLVVEISKTVVAALRIQFLEGIMLRDQIEYNEFCRRGQKQQKHSGACAGMPETPYGAKSHRPVD